MKEMIWGPPPIGSSYRHVVGTSLKGSYLDSRGS